MNAPRFCAGPPAVDDRMQHRPQHHPFHAAGGSGDQAAYYALPQTVVVGGFEAKKTTTAKGPVIDQVSCFDQLQDPVDSRFPPAAGSTTGGDPKCNGGNTYCLWQSIGLVEVPTLGDQFKIVGTPTLVTHAEPDRSAPRVKTEADLVVAQLGIVAALPAQRTYQTKYVVTLDPRRGRRVQRRRRRRRTS